jgi:hypothetical protein
MRIELTFRYSNQSALAHPKQYGLDFEVCDQLARGSYHRLPTCFGGLAHPACSAKVGQFEIEPLHG